MLRKKELIKCPVCKGTEKCEIDGSGMDGHNTLRTRMGGMVKLTLCLNCGCIFAAESELRHHRRNL